MSEKQKISRTLVGKVVSDSMNKTAVVVVGRKIQDPIYGKYIGRSTRVHIHDPENTCREGYVVEIKETRPISKTKNWQLVKILEKTEIKS